MSIEKQFRTLITATGTGGHIFPALFIARALRENASKYGYDSVKIDFLGTGRPLEQKLITDYPIHLVPMVGIKGRGVLGVIQFLSRLPSAFIGIWRLVNKIKPSIIIGVGGYGAVLPVLIGWFRGIPTWIHEAEVRPGMANRWLSIIATGMSGGFDRCEVSRKDILFAGHPVRPELSKVPSHSEVNTQPLNILVTGGSQGADALDRAMCELGGYLKEKGVNIRHQCREANVEKVSSDYASSGVKAEVYAFLDDMVSAYSWADIIICRSGAGSVMEVSAINRPAIFVPLPNSQGGHQEVNARYLSDVGKAITVLQDDNFRDNLRGAISRLLDPKKYNEMLVAPQRIRPLDAADQIAKRCLELASQ